MSMYKSRIESLPTGATIYTPSLYEAPIPGSTEFDLTAVSFNHPSSLNTRFFDLANPSVLATKNIYSHEQTLDGQISVVRPTAPYCQESYMIVSKAEPFFSEKSGAPLYYYPPRIIEEHYKTAIILCHELQKKYEDQAVLILTNSMQHVTCATPEIHPRPDEYSDGAEIRLGRKSATTKTIVVPHTHVVVLNPHNEVKPKIKADSNPAEVFIKEQEVIQNAVASRNSYEHRLEKKVIRMMISRHKQTLQQLIQKYLPAEIKKEFSTFSFEVEAEEKPPGYRFVVGNIRHSPELFAQVLKAHYFAQKTLCSRLFNYESQNNETLSQKEKFHLRCNDRIVPQPSFKEIIEITQDGSVVAHISPLIFAKVGPIESLGLNLVRLQQYQELDSNTIELENQFVIQQIKNLGY